MTPVVSISGISKSYGAISALDDVSLKVGSGELFGIIGPDGAGKSTLYRILATLLAPDTGSVSIFGLDTVRDFKQLRRCIGYMPERFSLYPDLTVMENLEFFATLFGINLKANYDIIAPVFSQLAGFTNRPAGKLSGGMKQKLALSCALIHKPKLLLLDEPTTGVDAVSRSEFWDILSDLRRQGMTILVSTSYMDEAGRCDRIAMMDRGKVIATNTPEGLVKNLDENLFNAKGPDMFGLLTRLRVMKEVTDCYTFGSTLHVVAKPGFNPDEAVKRLAAEGLNNISIYPAQGDIEDLFIKLTRHEE